MPLELRGHRWKVLLLNNRALVRPTTLPLLLHSHQTEAHNSSDLLLDVWLQCDSSLHVLMWNAAAIVVQMAGKNLAKR